MRRSNRAAVALVVAAALAAVAAAGFCGCGGGSANQSLGGTKWRLAGWSVSSLFPGDFEITAIFSGGKVSGKAAVNNYGGSYTASSDGDFLVGTLSMTSMAGPEPAMRAEGIFLKLLGQARLYRTDAGGLKLLDAKGNELLIFSPSG